VGAAATRDPRATGLGASPFFARTRTALHASELATAARHHSLSRCTAMRTLARAAARSLRSSRRPQDYLLTRCTALARSRSFASQSQTVRRIRPREPACVGNAGRVSARSLPTRAGDAARPQPLVSGCAVGVGGGQTLPRRRLHLRPSPKRGLREARRRDAAKLPSHHQSRSSHALPRRAVRVAAAGGACERRGRRGRAVPQQRCVGQLRAHAFDDQQRAGLEGAGGRGAGDGATRAAPATHATADESMRDLRRRARGVSRRVQR